MKKEKEAYNKLKSGADSQKTTEQTRPGKTEIKASGTREIKMVNLIYYCEKNRF